MLDAGRPAGGPAGRTHPLYTYSVSVPLSAVSDNRGGAYDSLDSLTHGPVLAKHFGVVFTPQFL
jgi:hypothetical protein